MFAVVRPCKKRGASWPDTSIKRRVVRRACPAGGGGGGAAAVTVANSRRVEREKERGGDIWSGAVGLRYLVRESRAKTEGGCKGW